MLTSKEFSLIASGGGSVADGVLQLSGGVPLDTTLRAVTDQANTSSPLQLSTTLVAISSNLVIGTTTASARLHVRGDGSNPVARFEDSSGVPSLRIENSSLRFGSSTPFGSLMYAMTGTTFSGNNNGTGLGFYSQFSIAGSSDRYDFGFGGDAVANTAGTVSHLALVRNFAAGAGAANYRPFGIYYTINNSGAQTGTATGIYLRGTETALNSMKHDLMDLGVGSTSRFMVLSDGRMRLAAVTAAAATTALGIRAAVQGDFFSVSTTDATFTAVGLWYYDGTNWVQL
jgi:hypothetical protein